MPRFSANLSMLFTEVPFLDRFIRARRAGFEAVEFLFPYDHPAQHIRERLDDAGLQRVHDLVHAHGDAVAASRATAATSRASTTGSTGI